MRREACRGFSQLEILTTLAIMAILLGAGVPSMAGLMQTNRLTAHLNDLTATLALARSVAIQHNQSVLVCKSSNQATCSANSLWAEGWLVFEDNDADNTFSPSDTLLLIHDPTHSSIHMRYNGRGTDHYLVFHGDGDTSNGTFSICDFTHSELNRALIINRLGRVRVATRLSDGSPITC
ncbi:MAG: GspH/FimT family pseudopilin [Gammaproteobacteria bacterium]|nr:GspH/FimT family pseudopilin [Gammaproteobacteria bacterium]